MANLCFCLPVSRAKPLWAPQPQTEKSFPNLDIPIRFAYLCALTILLHNTASQVSSLIQLHCFLLYTFHAFVSHVCFRRVVLTPPLTRLPDHWAHPIVFSITHHRWLYPSEIHWLSQRTFVLPLMGPPSTWLRVSLT